MTFCLFHYQPQGVHNFGEMTACVHARPVCLHIACGSGSMGIIFMLLFGVVGNETNCQTRKPQRCLLTQLATIASLVGAFDPFVSQAPIVLCDHSGFWALSNMRYADELLQLCKLDVSWLVMSTWDQLALLCLLGMAMNQPVWAKR